MKTFPNYAEAYAYARAQVSLYGHEQGIEAVKGPFEKGFRVFMLPKPENRQGHELTCEVVSHEPRMLNLKRPQ